jgi:uncharacterized protein with von Willebrand factor type A (vWA) domain
MQTVKRKPFSDLLFDQNLEKDFDFQNTVNDLPENFQEGCKDFFNIFHQGNLEYTDTPNPVEKFFLDSVKETEEFKSMMQSGTNHECNSWIYTRELTEKFSEWKNVNPDIEKDIEKNEPKNPKILKAKAKARQAVKDAEKESDEIGRFYDLSNPINSKDELLSKLELSKKLQQNPFLKKMVELAGRMKNKANSKLKQRTNYGRDAIVGIEKGNDISRLLPSELARFTDEDMSIFFCKDFTQENLLQFEMEGTESKMSGPVIVCLDQSSSMYGDCNLYGKAFLFGMYAIAKANNREFYVILFSSRIQEYHIESEKDIFKVMDSFMGGGTNFELPLLKTCEIIESNPMFKQADLIFITDGEGMLSDACKMKIKRIKEKLQFKILSLMIGYSDYILKEFSDKVFSIFNIYGNASDKFLDEAMGI